MTGITIRHLEGMEEYIQAVTFQEETWGKGFSERVPKSLMKVTQRLGGVVAGAFDPGGKMVGFVYGMTGLEGGRVVHWSDILAVTPSVRDQGLGRILKLFQREAVLAMGVTRMYWTFDPLESRNAWLNLGKLGAVVREYVPDMYGASDSPVHRGLGTDRFVVTWELDSERVRERIAGAPTPGLEDLRGFPVAFPVREAGEGAFAAPAPEWPHGDTGAESALRRGAEAGGVRVPVPADVQRLRDRDPGAAAAWRAATRSVLHPAALQGWEVRELVRDGAVSYYVLFPPALG